MVVQSKTIELEIEVEKIELRNNKVYLVGKDNLLRSYSVKIDDELDKATFDLEAN